MASPTGAGWWGTPIPPPARRLRRLRPRGAAGNFGMEFVRTLWLGLALGPGPAAGHPQPCGVLGRGGRAGRLGVLLPRAPAARARAALAPRLPHNLSLELVAAAPSARDPASLARGLCQALAAPGAGVPLAFPEARPELLQLHFLAAATETRCPACCGGRRARPSETRYARTLAGRGGRGAAPGWPGRGDTDFWAAGAGVPGARGPWPPDPGCPRGAGTQNRRPTRRDASGPRMAKPVGGPVGGGEAAGPPTPAQAPLPGPW